MVKKSKRGSTRKSVNAEDHVQEIKNFYKEFEDLNDQPLLMLAAYGLVEWSKDREMDSSTKAAFTQMNNLLGLEDLHKVYSTRIQKNLAPSPNQLWTTWCYYTTQPFKHRNMSRLKIA